MAEASQYVFSYKELAEILIKEQDIHEGLWSIYMRFGISAANIGFGGKDALPTAMVPVIEIGIQKQQEENPLTVDAAAVNPRSPNNKKKVPK